MKKIVVIVIVLLIIWLIAFTIKNKKEKAPLVSTEVVKTIWWWKLINWTQEIIVNNSKESPTIRK